jgi:hypothetical protein
MDVRVHRPLYAAAVITCSLLSWAAPAHAQFQSRSSSGGPAAESYLIEAAAGYWFPGAEIQFASGGSGVLSGIPGTAIDAKTDLGLTDQHFPEIHVEFRPARKHKLRFQYIPIKYDQTSTLSRDIIFNGQRYRLGIPTASTLDWKAYRFGYEYDFIANDRGFGGVIVDFKYTDVTVNLVSPIVTEFARARAPIPALGGVGRVYVVPAVSITGEVTAFKLPDSAIKDSGGHYVDIDIYGTINFTKNVGVQVGFRSFNLGYTVNKDEDTGSFVLKGLFFGVVARY